ncbi:MAG TPA: helix-turn-helix domain-containing protein [Candidatus Fournierella merdigallinarum]|nr:helix-turn-helix domain-containing protein [Candidatus Fournierella merdigallinarum]
MEHIGQTVQRLRRAKGLTQGQLAAQLGVSSAAVSKWETGGALPDVALLCPLARALGCSADELLGFRPELSAEEIDAVCKTPKALFDAGDWHGALEFCRRRLREYPGDLHLRFRLGFLLAGFGDKAGDDTAREALKNAAAGLFEQAVELPDEEQRRAAWRMLARLYADKGQFDRALEALGNLPSCNQEGQGLRADILRRMGDLAGAARLEESALAAQLAALEHTLASLAATRRAQGQAGEADALERQARRLKELFGAPAPAGGCRGCKGEPRDETEV